MLELLFLLILILLNAFFAASEIALISINEHRLKLMVNRGNKKARLLQEMVAEPSKFLATIQIGITLAGFLASAFAAESFSGRLVKILKGAEIPVSGYWLNNIALFTITVLLSYFTLVLGELVPKRLAMKKTEQIALLAVSPLKLLSFITAPFIRLLTLSTNTLVRLLGGAQYEKEEEVTEEEIRMLVDAGEEKGTIHETEKEMINNIFDFDNKTVADVMTHRTDITALAVDTAPREVVSLISAEKYTRFPVYEGSIDNIVGVLHTKDLIRCFDPDSVKGSFQLQQLLRPPYYVPSSIRTDVLFMEMKKRRTHMAVIIDEYGGTAGIVTMENLVEEIVGNIFDEYDVEERNFAKLDGTTYIIKGTTRLVLVQDYLETELPVDEYDTLGGFLVGQLGRIPEENEKPELEYKGLLFKVEEVQEKRVTRVKVCRVS